MANSMFQIPFHINWTCRSASAQLRKYAFHFQYFQSAFQFLALYYKMLFHRLFPRGTIVWVSSHGSLVTAHTSHFSKHPTMMQVCVMQLCITQTCITHF